MEGTASKGTAVAALSLGMVGVIAAWYGFSNMNDDDAGEKTPDPPQQDSAVASTKELREMAEKRDTDKQLIEHNVKLAIKELKDAKDALDKADNMTVTANKKVVNKDNVVNEDKVVQKDTTQPVKKQTDEEKWRAYWAEQFTTAPRKPETTAADYN